MPDVATPPQYLQKKLYTARQDRGLIADIYQRGVRKTSDLEVLPVLGVGRSIQVSAGVCYVPGTKYPDLQGTYRFVSETSFGFTLDSAATYPRIDRIIARVYDGQENNSNDDNRGAVEVLKGIEASGANLDNRAGAQDLPFDCLLLAEVVVGVGAGHTLSSSSVRDLRSLAAYNSPFFESFVKPLGSVRSDGIVLDSDAKVTPVGATGGMTMNVSAGNAWITTGGVRTFSYFPATSFTFTAPASSFQNVAVYASLPSGSLNGARAALTTYVSALGAALPATPANSILLAAGVITPSLSTFYRAAGFSNPIGSLSLFRQASINMGPADTTQAFPLSALEPAVGGVQAASNGRGFTINSPGRYKIDMLSVLNLNLSGGPTAGEARMRINGPRLSTLGKSDLDVALKAPIESNAIIFSHLHVQKATDGVSSFSMNTYNSSNANFACYSEFITVVEV